MTNPGRTIITLQEYRPQLLPRSALTEAIAEQLWREYRAQVLVEFPSPITEGQWRLTAQGFVGHIPLTPQLGLIIEPKVPVRSLFAMLAYVDGVQPLQFLPNLTNVMTIAEAYEQLAELLARRVLHRCRNGLVREYVALTEELNVVRGSVNIRRMAQRPWEARLECRYEEHTPDVDDNQILAWTLFIIFQSGICRHDHALPVVQRALRLLQSIVTLTPVSAAACRGRRYHRLNADYAPLHVLCRFFLEHSGPLHSLGDRAMVPFLIDTARLYEQCVAGWLRTNLSPIFRLHDQERYIIDRTAGLSFAIDLVIRERQDEHVRYVLDTKYKRVGAPSTDDIAQVVAYAEALDCHDVLLVYPYPPARPLDTKIGAIRVRTAVFALDNDLDDAGQAFVTQLVNG